ncbi:sugar ABC transporter ATP-binding protein [Haliscomenobacter hydrossis]|uniref:Autoinducer 2 import ATP-binding protein LsrA n=1 Tax=Haliscomenobacter hydrossis (strain ATCC 27775 / DSM 1100 / LMG 10767 / O) TaxID=760192 RepID=F4KV34_HALH1|nr:sugar ABC transporter ATP-binding protein [Haliscomenobacter hydrossis]AEE49200.1 Monosaccharide-transporting ATPase [Haliscomenobacter hydrossis DSM 1100]
MLELKNISKAYPGVQALSQVSLHIQAGEIHAICGENGAGKSTLMNIIAGNIDPDDGELIWEGRPVRFNSFHAAAALGIAIVYQERSLVDELSVAENIYVQKPPLTNWGLIDFKQLRQQTLHLLQRLGLEDIAPQSLVNSLSPAQKQMVEIAKALAAQPKLLILDEPTSSIGEKESTALFKILQKLKETGTAIIYISHRMAEIFQIADRITVLKDGVGQGSFSAAVLNPEQLIQLMVGRALLASSFYTDAKNEPCLDVVQITGPGFQEISFDIKKGEIFALAGLIGAGRTELALALFGDAPIYAGKVLLNGHEVHFKHPADAIAQGIAYVPEERKSAGVFLERSIAENVQASLLSKSFWVDVSASVAATHFREKLNIKTPSLQQKAGLLSGGNQQKVVLAKWLATQPSLLIIDEPTHGIDVGAKAEIYQILKDLTRQGLSILLISSELPEVLLLADRIGVMRGGRLLQILDKNEASETLILSLAAGTHG